MVFTKYPLKRFNGADTFAELKNKVCEVNKMVAIEFDNLTKYYGKNKGIENISLSIEEGEFFGFIGPNGAGKSTTIKVLLNLLFPSKGKCRVFDLDSVKDTVEIKNMISYVPSEVKFYNTFKVKDIFEMTMQIHGIDDISAYMDYVDYFQIDLNKKFGSLSLGNKKKVAVVDALISNPKLIILDEPTSGLDPMMQRRLLNLLKKKNSEGTTIFLSSHILSEIQHNCNRIAFIKDGEIIKVEKIDKEFLERKIIRITGDHDDTPLTQIGCSLVNKKENEYDYSFKGDLKNLMQALIYSGPSNFTIENPSLEDEFLKYYENDEKGDEIDDL